MRGFQTQARLTKQTGSTLTGFIMGLVLGLTIAVVVALVINKAATPFTNKGAKDKADTPVTQMQDPNKPLFGNKEPVVQAAKEVAASKAEMVKAAPASKPVEAAAASNATKNEPADDKFIYFLQVGAFKDAAEAEAARAKLALVGVEASVTEKSSDSGTLHRVRVGPFDHVDAMNKMRSKLSESGVEAAIVRSAK